MSDHNGPQPTRTLQAIISAYRAIKREHEVGREEWMSLQREPRFDAFVEAVDVEAERLGIRSPEEREQDKLKLQWWRLLDAGQAREVDAFAMFTTEEQEMLERHTERLISEAYALCLNLQEACPKLRDDGFNCGEVIDLWRWHKALYHAMRRLSRRWDGWEDVHGLIRDARKLLEQAQSEFVN